MSFWPLMQVRGAAYGWRRNFLLLGNVKTTATLTTTPGAVQEQPMRDWEQPAIPQQANQNSAFDSQFVARRPAQPANPPPPPPPPKPQPVPSQQWRRVANSHAQEREDIVVRFEEAPRSPLHPSTPPKYLAIRCMSIAGMTRFLGFSSLRRMQRLSTPATHPFFFCLLAPTC